MQTPDTRGASAARVPEVRPRVSNNRGSAGKLDLSLINEIPRNRSLNSALDGDEQSASRSGRFAHGERPSDHEVGLNVMEKRMPLPIPRIEPHFLGR
jgi:hypothetical protein